MALVPLAVWTARLDRGREGRGLSIRGGAALGATYFGLVFHWVPVALFGADPGMWAAAYSLGSYLVIVVGLAGLTALFVSLFHHGVHLVGAPIWLTLAVAWTALEWSRAHLPDTLALPWLGLGTSLTGYPELVGAAEVVGARGITFWLAAVNGLVATAWLRRRGGAAAGTRAWWRPAVGALVLASTVAGWGVWRSATLASRPVATVALVQPAALGRTKVTPRPPTATEVDAALPRVAGRAPVTGRASETGRARETEQAGEYTMVAGSADVVVLPELFLRADPRSVDAEDATAVLRDFSRSVEAPVLFGALGRSDDDAPTNAVYLMEAPGLSDFHYDKRRLVPMVERIPFVGNAGGGYAVGDTWSVAEVAGVGYGVLICYESSYPGAARALRLAGADVLVNVTNDAWLAGLGPFRRSVALWQHPAHLVMRAIEGRVGVVRSATAGISMFVDPVGRTHRATDPSSRVVALHQIHTTDEPTFFVRYGDLLGNASAFAALMLLLHAWVGSNHRPGARLDPQGPRV